MSHRLRSWLKFNIVGCIGVAVQLSVLTVLKTGFGLRVLAATAVAVECALLHNFVWHERWTWAHRGLDFRGSLRRLVRFNACNGLISVLGNLLLMYLLVERLHVHFLAANVAAIAACGLLNFFVSDRLVFRQFSS